MKINFKKPNFDKIFVFLRNNQKKLLKYYHQILLPLGVVLIIYALIFQAVADNLNFRKVKITIIKNETANQILFDLVTKGVVRNWYNAKLAMMITGWQKQFFVGRYSLSPDLSVREVFAVLRGKRGPSEDQNVPIVVPEGYSLPEIMEALAARKIVSKEDLAGYLATTDLEQWRRNYPFLKNNTLDRKHFFEGYLFPDTYNFPEKASPNVVLEIMLDNFARNVLPLMRYNKTKLNLHQIVTLASIIEKEAMDPKERDIISGVFYKRYLKRMYLGSCPTVKYALGKPHKKYLLYKDLNVVSPYNTYRHIGLPPGPIASPGLLSIKAALDPADTPYLYFVSKGDGTHLFGRTEKEHLENQKLVKAGQIY